VNEAIGANAVLSFRADDEYFRAVKVSFLRDRLMKLTESITWKAMGNPEERR